jgi:hypothetical protein
MREVEVRSLDRKVKGKGEKRREAFDGERHEANVGGGSGKSRDGRQRKTRVKERGKRKEETGRQVFDGGGGG